MTGDTRAGVANMRRATQLKLARTLFGYIDTNQQAPALAPFLDPARGCVYRNQAAREREHLLRNHPLIAEMTADLPKPGDFFTNDLTGRSIPVVRGKDGAAQALVNVRCHGGAKRATAGLAERCAPACRSLPLPTLPRLDLRPRRKFARHRDLTETFQLLGAGS